MILGEKCTNPNKTSRDQNCFHLKAVISSYEIVLLNIKQTTYQCLKTQKWIYCTLFRFSDLTVQIEFRHVYTDTYSDIKQRFSDNQQFTIKSILIYVSC